MERVYYLSVESLTAAMKGYRALSNAGIRAHVERISPHFSRRGCGYGIAVWDESGPAKEILRKNYIKILSISER